MPNHSFTYSLVVNEVSDDLDQSMPFARTHGMSALELDTAWGVPIETAGADDHARVRDALQGAGLEPAMVLSPAFKALRLADADPDDLASLAGWREHLDELEAAMNFASAIGCPRVRLFTGRRDVGGDNPSPRLPDGGGLPAERLDAIRAILLDAAHRAEALGLTLCVENVRSCFGNTGRNTAAILAAVDHPSVRAIWDPANDFVSGGDDFRAGYEAVKPWMVHVHAKDATEVDAATGLTAWTAIGQGDLDWPAQMRALMDDGYSGHISLETHWHPEGRSRVQNSHDSFMGLRQAVQAAAALSSSQG